MKRCFAVAFSCVVFAITSLSQNEAPKESQRQSIQGKVVEAKSGQPIRKVIFGVSFCSATGRRLRASVSSSAPLAGCGPELIERAQDTRRRYPLGVRRSGYPAARPHPRSLRIVDSLGLLSRPVCSLL